MKKIKIRSLLLALLMLLQMGYAVSAGDLSRDETDPEVAVLLEDGEAEQTAYNYCLFQNGMNTWNDPWYIDGSNSSSEIADSSVLGRFGNNITPWVINLWSYGYTKQFFNNTIDLSDEQLRANTVLSMDVKVADMTKTQGDTININLGDKDWKATGVSLPGFILTETETRKEDTLNGWMHYEIPLSDFNSEDGFDWAKVNAVTFATGNWQGGQFYFDNIGFTPAKPEIVSICYYDENSVLVSDNGTVPADAKYMEIKYNKDMQAASIVNIKFNADGEMMDANAEYDVFAKTVTVDLSKVDSYDNLELVIPDTVITLPAAGKKDGDFIDASIDTGSVSNPQTIVLRADSNGFYAADGSKLAQITVDGNITAKVRLDVTAKVCIAVYNNGVLVSTALYDGSVGENVYDNIAVKNGQNVKMFIWESIEGMTPIMPEYGI